MNDNLNREKIASWSAEVWKAIDQAVADEVGRIRVAQKVFPCILMPDATSVPVEAFTNPVDAMEINEGQTKPLIEIAVQFALTQGQVDNEATLKTAVTLARAAAKTVAFTEDNLILHGDPVSQRAVVTAGAAPRVRSARTAADAKKVAAAIPKELQLINDQTADDGLSGLAEKQKEIFVRPSADAKAGTAAGAPVTGPNEYGEQIFKAVTAGIAFLVDQQQPGPYALLLDTTTYADSHAPVGGQLVTTADRLTPLLSGGFYGTGAMPDFTGLLVSLGGQPTTIYIAKDAITQYTQPDPGGKHRFRVFQRIQFVARDPRAFVKLSFLKTGDTVPAAPTTVI